MRGRGGCRGLRSAAVADSRGPGRPTLRTSPGISRRRTGSLAFSQARQRSSVVYSPSPRTTRSSSGRCSRESSAAMEAWGPPRTVNASGMGRFGQGRTSLKLWKRFSVVDRDADDIGFVAADFPLDLPPAQPQDIGRNDFDRDPFFLQHRADVEQAEGRHGRALGPALGEISSGRDVELDLNHLGRRLPSFRASSRRPWSRSALPWSCRRCNRRPPWSCSCG